MSTIFVRHQVADYDTWKPGYDDHQRTRREYGLTDAGLYRGVEEPNDVTIVLTTDDLARAREFLDSQDLKDTMADLGVVSAPEVWVTDTA